VNVIITIYTKPNARENKLVWVDEDTIQVWVAAVPKKGKANKELVDFLAKTELMKLFSWFLSLS